MKFIECIDDMPLSMAFNGNIEPSERKDSFSIGIPDYYVISKDRSKNIFGGYEGDLIEFSIGNGDGAAISIKRNGSNKSYNISFKKILDLFLADLKSNNEKGSFDNLENFLK